MKKKLKTKGTGGIMINPTKKDWANLSTRVCRDATERQLEEMEAEKRSLAQKFAWARALNKAQDRWAGTPMDDLFEHAAEVIRAVENYQTKPDTWQAQLVQKIYQQVGEKFVLAMIKGDVEWLKKVAEHLPAWRAHHQHQNPDVVKAAWISAGTPGKAVTVAQLNSALTAKGFKKKDSSYLRREARKAGLTIGGGKRGRPAAIKG